MPHIRVHPVAGFPFLIFLLFSTRAISAFHLVSKHKAKPSAVEEEVLYPTVEVLDGADTVWQVPGHCKAVLFIAHPSGADPFRFWDPHPRCPQCTGYPEHRALVQTALWRGYAVIVIGSLEHEWQYRDLDSSRDFQNVEAILGSWTVERGLEKLPLTALGISLGGIFVAAAADRIAFDAVGLMISSGLEGGFRGVGSFPPVLFLHMPKDWRIQPAVAAAVAELQAQGIPAAAVECLDFPVQAGLFAERIHEIDEEQSAKIRVALQDVGVLDGAGYVVDDYAQRDWRSVVREVVRGISSELELTLERIAQELNLAYAFHATTSLKSRELFEWLDSKGQMLSQLEEELR